MVIVIREFQSPDEEMKKIALKVVKKGYGRRGPKTSNEILPEFFRNFWVRRMALTEELQTGRRRRWSSGKVGCAKRRQ